MLSHEDHCEVGALELGGGEIEGGAKVLEVLAEQGQGGAEHGDGKIGATVHCVALVGIFEIE